MKKITLNEQITRIKSIMGINESKKTKEEAERILAGTENAQGIIQQFMQGDKSTDQKYLGIMAFIYKNFNYTDVNNIVSIMMDYDGLIAENKIKPLQIVGKTIKIGEKVFTDFLKFSEFIHGEKNKHGSLTSANVDTEAIIANKKPMWSGNGIDIYEGDEVGKCIAYTMGGLTGRAYSFCIGQPANTQYQSYRDSKVSSFYFIIDKNHMSQNDDGSPNLEDPLHIVVFDQTRHGIELTDATNRTGTIAEPYGSDPEKYVEYLKSKGVPVDELENRPKTNQERQEDTLLGKQNNSLEWFMKLPFEMKSKYIGRGHILTDDQFDYLMGK